MNYYRDGGARDGGVHGDGGRDGGGRDDERNGGLCSARSKRSRGGGLEEREREQLRKRWALK